MNGTQTFKYKIVVIGDGGVGKTSLIKKFTHGIFINDYIKTIGAQFTKIEKNVNGNDISLIFWDIAGQGSFDFLNSLFYKDSKACIIVFSLEENDLGSDSFKHVKKWNDEFKNRCEKMPVVLFANKVDLIQENDLDISKIQMIVNELNIFDYYLTSAKTGQGVSEAFNMLIAQLNQKSKFLT